MAKFDTSKIEGFDGMDDAAKVQALLGADIPDAVDLSQYVSKSIADKYASEAADWRHKYNGKLSEDEKKKEENEQSAKELQEKYDALLKKTTIAEYKAKYLGMGYDEKSAGEIAQALLDGNTEKMFEVMANHQSGMKEKIKEDLLKSTPKPDGAGAKDDKDKDTPDILIAKKLSEASKKNSEKSKEAIGYYFK